MDDMMVEDRRQGRSVASRLLLVARNITEENVKNKNMSKIMCFCFEGRLSQNKRMAILISHKNIKR